MGNKQEQQINEQEYWCWFLMYVLFYASSSFFANPLSVRD